MFLPPLAAPIVVPPGSCVCEIVAGADNCRCDHVADLTSDDHHEIVVAKLDGATSAQIDALIKAKLAALNKTRHAKKDHDDMPKLQDYCKDHNIRFDTSNPRSSALALLAKLGFGPSHPTGDAGIRLDARSDAYLETYARSQAEHASSAKAFATIHANHEDSGETDANGVYRYDGADEGPSAADVAAHRASVRYRAFHAVAGRHRNDATPVPREAEVEAEIDRLVTTTRAPRASKPIRDESVAARHADQAARQAVLRPTGYVSAAHDPRTPLAYRKGGK